MSALSRREFVQKGTAAGVALASSRAAAEGEARVQEAKNPWLVMVYLAGDNNLSEDMVLALQDLQAEGPPSGDKIVAQFDPSGVGLFTQRYDFSLPKGPTLESYRDKTYGGAEGNTGSGEALVDFIRWAHKEHPEPTRHLLILSGHGSGTTEDFFLSDQTSRDSLTVDELRKSLEEAKGILQKKIDVLGMDACYMSMGEIAYEIRDHAGILVGAEGLEPQFGWPYRRILARARAFLAQQTQPTSQTTGSPRHMDPRELATAIVQEYVSHYSDYDRSVGRSSDLAAVDLAQTVNVKDAFANLVRVLPTPSDKEDHQKLLLAHWYAQTYKDDQFVDLADLCDQVAVQFRAEPEIPSACRAVTDAILRGAAPCIIKSGCNGFACQYSYGLSIYFPWAIVSPEYGNLSFAKGTAEGGTGWLAFLETHINATRRDPPRYTQQTFLPTRVDLRLKRLNELLTLAKTGTQSEIDALAEEPRALVLRMKALYHLSTVRKPAPGDKGRAVENKLLAEKRLSRGDIETALRYVSEVGLAGVLEGVAAADIPDQDVSGELALRALRAGSIGARVSKHSEHTKHSDHTKARDERESWVKNLPPGIGTAYWPPTKEAAKS